MQTYFGSEWKEHIRGNGSVTQVLRIKGDDSTCARCVLRSSNNRPENMPETKVDCSRTFYKQKCYTI
jgi:hypothetical protein